MPKPGLPGLPYESRPGVRGGTDQFSWEDVKGDQDKSYYLGHSIKAPYGRWQKGRDIYWYNKVPPSAKMASGELEREKKEVQKREKALRQLVLNGGRVQGGAKGLERFEAAELFGFIKKDEGDAADSDEKMARGTAGVGFSLAGPGGGKNDGGICFSTEYDVLKSKAPSGTSAGLGIIKDEVVKGDPATPRQPTRPKSEMANEVTHQSWPGAGLTNETAIRWRAEDGDSPPYNNRPKKSLSCTKLAKKRRRLEKRIAALKAKTDRLRRKND